MFMASCYWPPVPLDTPLDSPWSDNITTFGEALLSRIPNLPVDMIPAAVPIIDRCWCDFSGGLFEPFNTTRWEANSIEKLARELEIKLLEAGVVSGETDTESAPPVSVLYDKPEATPSVPTKIAGMLEGVWPFSRAPPAHAKVSLASQSRANNGTVGVEESSERRYAGASSPISPQKLFAALRTEYDLRPYGFDMVVDLGWSR